MQENEEIKGLPRLIAEAKHGMAEVQLATKQLFQQRNTVDSQYRVSYAAVIHNPSQNLSELKHQRLTSLSTCPL